MYIFILGCVISSTKQTILEEFACQVLTNLIVLGIIHPCYVIDRINVFRFSTIKAAFTLSILVSYLSLEWTDNVLFIFYLISD